MKIECLLLAPFTCGVIVAFASVVMNLMVTLGTMFSAFTGNFTGISAPIAVGTLNIFQNVNKVISPEIFQIVVGIYMIEIIYLLSMFQSKLENGEDKHTANVLAAKYLFLGCIIYTGVLIVSVLIFNALLPITSLGGV
jgi:hypothetical protein